ncbi:MAG: pyridoxamine 5'-phosphate oxidase family protein [Rhizobiales bacterium]|nr:pyridoxamine 5'-phosphate oxidase family protein [Hyphomicrobiales bacterium]
MTKSLEQRFSDPVTTQDQLRDVLGTPSPIARDKVIDHIDSYCAEFIEHAPFVVLSTRGERGEMDLSPRGDPAGFVKIIDERTLAVPDRLGNNRADTFVNLLANPEIGLIFLVPGKRETLRVSGKGLLVRDGDLRASLAHKDKVPHLVLVVEVKRVMFQCAKCMVRSKLWQPDSWANVSGMSSLAEAIKVHSQLQESVAEIDEVITRSSAERLY